MTISWSRCRDSELDNRSQVVPIEDEKALKGASKVLVEKTCVDVRSTNN